VTDGVQRLTDQHFLLPEDAAFSVDAAKQAHVVS
jgi:hypothetical protein